MRFYTFFSLLLCFCLFGNAQKNTSFNSGKPWLDNNGVHINAHGGLVISHKKTYYWYGEHKLPNKSEDQFADGGIHCYSSKDLLNWKDEGVVLSVDYSDTAKDLAYGCILERPKVVYDKKQKHFIVYFKYYPKGTKYEKGYIGVATSKSPTGPFAFKHKFLGGNSAYGTGDFSMYENDDNKVYHLTVRKPDKTFVIGTLDDTKMMPFGQYQPAKAIEKHTEAPAVVKHEGKYYLLGSGSSGWKPNKARSYVVDSLFGEFKNLGNPCIGRNPHNGIGADTSFGGQINFILKVPGKKNAYIAMFDIWKPDKAIEGLYIWLPLVFKDGNPKIEWIDSWDLSYFK